MLIKNAKQISSKTGDSGSSKNYNNDTFKKNDILFEVMGTIDELSSFLGLAYHHTKHGDILVIQKKLENINSAIATSEKSEFYNKINRIKNSDIDWLENEMQHMLDKNPIEAKFVLPGSEKSKNGAYIDIARSLSRRAERRLVNFIEKHSRKDLENELKYLNRLSDYLFVLSNNL